MQDDERERREPRGHRRSEQDAVAQPVAHAPAAAQLLGGHDGHGKDGNGATGEFGLSLPDRYQTHTAFQPTTKPRRATLKAHTDAKGEEKHLKRMRTLAAVAVIAAGALSLAGLAGASAKKDSLQGAGSTFVAPLVAQWQAHYPNADINYSAIGSGAGIAQISARTVDFGASDAPMTRDQFAACHGCVQIPWAFSATSVMYNVSGVGYGLKLTGPVLANIYLGHIKKWNDKRIRSINKGVNLPQRRHRPDLPQRRKRHQLQLHRLPLPRQQGVEEQDRQEHAAGLPRRRRRERQLGRLREAPDDAGRHHLRRHRIRLQVPLQGREDEEWRAGSSWPRRPCRRSQST